VRFQVASVLLMFLSVFPLPNPSVSAFRSLDERMLDDSDDEDGIHRLRVSASLCSAMKMSRHRYRGSGSSYPLAHRISTFDKTGILVDDDGFSSCLSE
jgi:hypothetical protein